MDSWSLALRSPKPTVNFPYSQQPSKPLPAHLAHFESLVTLAKNSERPLYTQEIITGLEDANSIITATV